MKQQQETLSGITSLAEKLPDFTAAEGEVKSIQDKLGALDIQSAEQIRILSDPSIQLPEFQCGIEEELKELRKTITSIEPLHATSGLKGKIDLKVTPNQTSEIACKEEVVTLMQSRTEESEKVREEWRSTKDEFATKSNQSGSEYKEVISGMSQRYEKEKEVLMDYLVEGTLRTPGAGQNSLESELMEVVSTFVTDLRASLARGHQELDLEFSLEFLSLRAELAGLRAQAVPRTVSESSGTKEVEERLGVVTESLEKVDKEQKETISALLDVVDTVEKSIQDISTSLTSYLSSNPQSSFQRTDLESHLNSALFQIDMLRKQTDSLDSRLTVQLAHVLSTAEDLEAAKSRLSQSGDEAAQALPSLIPRVNQSQTDLPPIVQSLKEKIAGQVEALKTVWTNASEKVGITTPDQTAWELPWITVESS